MPRIHPEKRCADCKGPLCLGYPTPIICRSCYQKRRYLSPEDKFWKYVKKTESCWLWFGAKTSSGYGLFSVKGISYAAHRFSYALHHRNVPEGKIICHDCPGGDNPLCVNPKHLYAGTHSDNNSDSVRKGTALLGEQKPNAVLTNEKVREIKQTYVKRYGANTAMARKYGVKVATIDAIIAGRNWKHIH